jgi:ATP-dependent helicase/DNAse subunit B
MSPHQLSDYGNCPFQALLKYACGLEEPEEANEELGLLNLGKLYHRALQLFFSRRRAAKALPVRGTAEEEGVLASCLEEASQALELEVHVGHPAVWEIRRSNARELLTRLIEAEAESPWLQGLVPAAFEQEFGGAGAPALEVTSPDGRDRVVLGGRADRIDSGGSSVGVIDYKSGKAYRIKDSLRDHLLVTDVQLPFYLAVARAAYSGSEAVDAAYVSVGSAEAVRLSDLDISLADLLELDPERRAVLRQRPDRPPNFADTVWKMADGVRSGRFPVYPVDCQYCRFESVCRIGARATRPEEGSSS